MRRLLDKSLLLLYCFSCLYFISTNTALIFALLFTVSIACLNEFFFSRRFVYISTLLYGICALFLPEFRIFLPVILYDGFYKSFRFPVLLGILGSMLGQSLPPSQLFWSLIIGICISALLAYRGRSYETLDVEYRQTRDDSTERTLFLKEKNQALVEKQDYEIYTATLKERNRIAREIHDNVGHMLSRSILMVGALKTVADSDTVTQPLQQLEDTLNTAMDSIRSSVHDLHDESVNLHSAVEDLTKSFTFCKAEFTYDMEFDVPREIKYSFISITKEALVNITKHSNATLVQIIMREHPALYQLIISDNGSDVGPVEETGIGLTNIRERVLSIGGTTQIHTDRGFRIFITVPKQIKKQESED